MKKQKNKRKTRKIISKVFKYFILILSLFIIFLAIYINRSFENLSFEQILYNVIKSEGSSYDIVIYGGTFILICISVTIFIVKILEKLINKIKLQANLSISYKSKKVATNLFSLTTKKKRIILLLLFIFSLYFFVTLLKIDEYLKAQLNPTEIFEKYYVDGSKVEIKFPKKKQNLIYIYLESMEMTNASLENGGALKKSYIPNLEKIALDNINFSNTSKLGGSLQIYGTGWTAAAMIAQTSGVPLKLSIDSNSYTGYGDSMPGVYNLGDILKENGYHNYLMIGSDATFGGRRDYFTYHGDYTIYDYLYAKEQKWIDEDYKVWWGYEDSKLFEFSKKQLLKIAKKDEPFNFTMLTADTHFVDGYLDDSCQLNFDNKYANVFSCSDNMVFQFIEWIKEQDFYKDTTVIIVGDHFTMQTGFYNDINQNYKRNVYNAFINSKETTKNSKNRYFSSFDLFPTTLAAIGVEIKGDRLGLGTNLFSNKKTLIEELGFDYMNKELSKKSDFYNNKILGDTYYKMLEKKKGN